MVIGAVVGQVAEWMRERRDRPRPAGVGGLDMRDGQDLLESDSPPEGDRAIGGKLNPLNAAEDMLKRVIDHAQYRTDQSVRKAVSDLQQATERQWPLMSEQAQLAAERATELAAERLEGSSKRIAEDVAARTAIVLDEKLSRADALLRQQREDAVRHVTRLIIILGVVLLVMGAALIVLAAVLLE